MKKIIFLLLCCCLVSYAQKKTTSPCLTDELYSDMVKKDPKIKERLEETNKQIREFSEKKKKTANRTSAQTNYTIPVIVYVVHDNQPLGVESNITDAQVDTQIAALNTHFSNIGLTFCLATTAGNQTLLAAAGNKPNASASTTRPGIIHVNDTALSNHTADNSTQFNLNTGTTGQMAVLGKDKALRIWVVKSIEGVNSRIAGYSFYPDDNATLDGIVMDYKYFGDKSNPLCNCNSLEPNYQQGKVLAHEVGHYLGLRHTFEGGCHDNSSVNCLANGDYVCDTPPVKVKNEGCPTTVVNSCNDLPDDISNFMDYTYDACKDHFTNGQKERMLFHLFNYRSNLYYVDNLIFMGVCGSNTLVSSNFTGSLENTGSNYIYNICAGSTMYFKPVTTSAVRPGTTYSWDFGNGSTSTLENPSTTFTSASNNFYNVTLTTTYNGVASVSTKKVFINNCMPIVNRETTWYHSGKNILNFNTGIPRNAGIIDYPFTGINWEDGTFKDVSNQNDAQGNVLFFTDGRYVFSGGNPATKLHTTELLGGKNNINNSNLILKSPSNSNQYYVFYNTLVNDGVGTGKTGTRYSIVNVTNGIASMSSSLNMPIIPTATQTDYFTSTFDSAFFGGTAVIALEKVNGGYWLFKSLLKTDGKLVLGIFDFAVNGSITLVNTFLLPQEYWESNPSSIFGFKRNDNIVISPNGDKLFYSGSNTNSLPLILDFDKFSGVLSQTSTFDFIKPTIFKNFNGTFSPNSKFFYSEYGQMDIDSKTIFSNPNSITLPIRSHKFTKIGPDSKLYYVGGSEDGKTNLNVIHKPNEKVTSFEPNAFLNQQNIFSFTHQPDFNSFLPNNYISKKTTAYDVNQISAYKSGCNAYKFFPDVPVATATPTFRWDFGDPNSGTTNNASTLNTPIHIFSNSGTYTVKLYVNGSTTNFIQTQVTVDAFTAPAIQGTTTQCFSNGSATSNNSVALKEGQTVVWSITGGTGAIFANGQSEVEIRWTALPGTISAVITDASGCTATVTKTITEKPNTTPTFSGIASSSICPGGTVPTLPTTSTNSVTGRWTPEVISNTATGSYTFNPDSDYCATPVTITITVTPNATPTFNLPTTICSGTSVPVLPTTSTNGISGTWSPAVSNTATTTYTFTPGTSQCGVVTTHTITVLPTTNAQCGSGTPGTGDCFGTLTFTAPETALVSSYKAGTSITTRTDYVVNSGAKITMKAGGFVLMSSSTWIKAGADYRAFTQACVNGVARSEEQAVAIEDEKLEEESDASAVTIYPNPTDGLLTVTAKTKISKITISSIDGKTILNQTFKNSNATEFNLSNYERGTYILRMETADGNLIIKKIIKK